MSLTRKEFIQAALASLGAAAFVSGCGDDTTGSGGSGGGGTTTGSTTGGTTTSGSTATGMAAGCSEIIMGNHGHVLEVSDADVTAAVDKTYDIQGGSPHTHSVTVTAADFATLAGGGSVTLTSTDGSAHTHSITVSMC